MYLTDVNNGSPSMSSICLRVVKPALSRSFATAPPTPNKRPISRLSARNCSLRGWLGAPGGSAGEITRASRVSKVDCSWVIFARCRKSSKRLLLTAAVRSSSRKRIAVASSMLDCPVASRSDFSKDAARVCACSWRT